MKWVIDKQFDFCFGHRVWSQQLDTKYSLDGCMSCRHLHGHQGKIKLFLTLNRLENGMVTDFKHTNIFKQWVDDVLDHKFILDVNDPLFGHECPELYRPNRGTILTDLLIRNEEYDFWQPDMSKLVKTYILDLDIDTDRAIYEKYEGLVFVDFVPTSENLCRWWLEVAEKMLSGLGIQVEAVEYWETPKSHCRVTR